MSVLTNSDSIHKTYEPFRLNMRPSLRDQLAGTAVTESGMKFHSFQSTLNGDRPTSPLSPIARRFGSSAGRRHQRHDSLAILSTVTVETRVDDTIVRQQISGTFPKLT